MSRRLLVTMTGLLLAAPPARATRQVPDSPVPGSELSVHLVTIGPGAQVWERFGHNMLWIEGGATPVDSVWDWGRFQFDRGFLLRFARGDLRYWMMGAPAGPVVDWYGATGRRVSVQDLDLTPAQRLRLLGLLRTNDTEANRYYQYHYYNDNCSTRIRDALDLVLGGALRQRTDTALTPWSYRDQTKRLNQHNPLLYFGLTTLLAGATDRPITAWEEMFLPSGVERWVREIHVVDEDGTPKPFVAREVLVAPGGRYSVPDVPSRWWPGFLLAGLGGMALLVTSGRSTGRWRRVFLPAAFSYLFVAALFGLAMVFLWGFSGHQVAWRNENLLQFNLLALLLLPLLPAALHGTGPAGRLGRRTAFAMVVVSVLGVVLKLLPDFGQSNWEVMALAVPANLGVWLGVRKGGEQ